MTSRKIEIINRNYVNCIFDDNIVQFEIEINPHEKVIYKHTAELIEGTSSSGFSEEFKFTKMEMLKRFPNLVIETE